MTEIEQRKSRRLQFLRVVYDLAEGTLGNPVQGQDVAERLGRDLHGDEFHGLAYFHEKDGNTQALETNWGMFVITAKGIAEIESQAAPVSRRERRDAFLRALYDLGRSRTGGSVALEEIAPRLGMDACNPADNVELTEMARYWVERDCATRRYAGYGALSITSEGIDEVEGNRRSEAGSTTNIIFNAPVHGSVIGTHNTAELTNNFDFRAIEQRIEREGGEDKEELKRALAHVERLLERGDYLDRGALSQFSGAMERHSWFTSSVMEALLGFATQAVG